MFTETQPAEPSRLRRLATALTYPLPVDEVLQLANPLWSLRSLKAKVVSVHAETDRATTVVLKPGPGWAGHVAGQHLTLGVDVDGVRQWRCYSITTPGASEGGRDDRFSISVQAIPGGLVSNHVRDTFRKGQVVHLKPAQGDFTLPRETTVPMLFLSGGSGVTPIMGMLRALVSSGAGITDVVVVHHAPAADQVLFAAELDELHNAHAGLHLHVVLTGPGAPADELRLTAARLDEVCPDWRTRSAWACGPAPMLADVETTFADAGLADLLHLERFVAPAFTPAADPGRGGIITFTGGGAPAEGTDAVADGVVTLLDLAEASGLAPASGCRMGICHGCTAPLVAGCARDLRDGSILEAGSHIQICVSAAAGDATIAL